nr:MAG TPA: hypothetical protein [Caudoviricetes sp.]
MCCNNAAPIAAFVCGTSPRHFSVLCEERFCLGGVLTTSLSGSYRVSIVRKVP